MFFYHVSLYGIKQQIYFTQVVKKCGELWRDEVDEETKAKYKTLYKDRLERNSRFDTKVARPSATDVDKSEDMNARFEEDVDEKVNFPFLVCIFAARLLSILKLRLPAS